MLISFSSSLCKSLVLTLSLLQQMWSSQIGLVVVSKWILSARFSFLSFFSWISMVTKSLSGASLLRFYFFFNNGGM